jgi:arginyl-tRNA synthetase
MILKETKEILEDFLSKKIDQKVNFEVSFSDHKERGNLTTNFAMATAKILKVAPMVLAVEVVEFLNSKELFTKAEAVAPGFINISISREVLIKEINENLDFILRNKKNNQTVLCEYTDPNIFKPFHIGHLMANNIGESISRIYECAGYDVKRICYPGDIGRHVAMGIYAVLKDENRETFNNLEDMDPKDAAKFLGKCYAEGNKDFEDSEEAKAAIHVINQKIYDKSDPNINFIYEKGRKTSLSYFETLYKLLGTKFDTYIFESETADQGKKIVLENFQKGIFEEGDDGTVIYNGEPEGLHKRVFITSKGLPAYEAKDLGNNVEKVSIYPDLKKSIIVTASEQNDYFKVLFKALEKIFPSLSGKLIHIGHGMMRLADGKMSSRKGTVVYGDDMIDMVREALQEKFTDFEETEKKEVLNNVTVGAIKFGILKQDIKRDIIYDFEKAISFEGDSGPYLQYTHARCVAILNKAKDLSIKIDASDLQKEHVLDFKFMEFKNEFMKSLETNSPHYVAQYLLSLAHEVNHIYNSERVFEGENVNVDILNKVCRSKLFLEKGLYVLGIAAPDSM